MFTKSILSKYEWDGMPDDINELFIETLLYNSDSNNFAVIHTNLGEFWGYFNVLQRDEKYGIPLVISMTSYLGQTWTTENFVLFNNFRNPTTTNRQYIEYYSTMIANINKALNQHIYASELIATFTASNQNEKQELEQVFSRYKGIKILKQPKGNAPFEPTADLVEFKITPRTAELEQLKHELEKDLFLRLGIDAGVDKTHITDLNLKDSEQPLDLINAYELKLRENFCERYNAWNKANGYDTHLSVKIHEITNQNTISKNENETMEATDNGNV